MASTLTYRFARLGSQSARFAVAGVAALVVVAVSCVLILAGVDTVETVATLLVVPVFVVALYSGRGPGFSAAALATGAYVVLRRPDLGDTGSLSFALLIVTRAVAYGIVAHAGAWARTLVETTVSDADDWADSPLVLREQRRARGEPGEIEPWTSRTPVAAPAPAPRPDEYADYPDYAEYPEPEEYVMAPAPDPASREPVAALGPALFERQAGDDWVDEPHPSDWRVGPSALPPDDPESGPWTGPTELVPADGGEWGPGPGPGPGGPMPPPNGGDPWSEEPAAHPGGPPAPADPWSGQQPAARRGGPGAPWSGQQPAARGGGPADRWSGPQPAVPGDPADRWSGQQPGVPGGPGAPWSGQQPAARGGGPGAPWSGQQPAVPGDPRDRWSGQQPAARRGGPGDPWSGQQPAARGGSADPWSGQPPPVPGDPRDRWSGQQPAARGGGPGEPWSGQQPPVPGDPRDRRSGQQPAARGRGPGEPWSGQQPAMGSGALGAGSLGNPWSGQQPAVRGPGDRYSGQQPAVPGDQRDRWSGQQPAADEWGDAPAGPASGRWPAADPRAPGGEQEWEDAEAELAARLQEQQQPPDPWEQVQPDRMWRRRTGATPAVPSPPGGPGPGPMGPGRGPGPSTGPTPHVPPPGPPVPVPSRAQLPPVDPETKLWSARYLCDRLATEQREAAHAGRPFSLVLVQVPDGPLAALSYRRQVTLLRELGHQFVAGGLVDHLVHVPDQVQHWFAVILPDTDRASAKAFERRLRNGIGGYLRSRGLLLGDLESACLTSPDDDSALGVIWDTLIARGDPDAGRDRITRV